MATGDSVIFVSLSPFSSDIALAVERYKKSGKDSLVKHTLFFSVSELKSSIYIYIYSELNFILFHCNIRRDFGQPRLTEDRRASVTNKTLQEETEKQHAATCREV